LKDYDPCGGVAHSYYPEPFEMSLLRFTGKLRYTTTVDDKRKKNSRRKKHDDKTRQDVEYADGRSLFSCPDGTAGRSTYCHTRRWSNVAMKAAAMQIASQPWQIASWSFDAAEVKRGNKAREAGTFRREDFIPSDLPPSLHEQYMCGLEQAMEDKRVARLSPHTPAEVKPLRRCHMWQYLVLQMFLTKPNMLPGHGWIDSRRLQ